MNKTLIEEGNFELIKLFQNVSAEAKKEKNAVPPINEMLHWWTRKPLVVSRAVALASTLTDIELVKQLLNINKEKRAYVYSPNIEFYKQKLDKNAQIRVLDPFGGAGNLIFEASRLGLDCKAQDYNPVSYLYMKAVLQYPSRYGGHLAEDVQKYGKELIESTKKEIGKFFAREDGRAVAYIWAWCIRCPFCKQRIPLTNHMWIAKSERLRVGIKIIPTNDRDFKVKLVRDMDEKDGDTFTQKGGKALCIRCRNSIDYEHITNDIAKNKDKEMLAVVVASPSGKNYELPTAADLQNYKNASLFLKKNWEDYERADLIPHETIRASHRRENLLWHYGIKEWHQFFNDRQLLVMVTLLKKIQILQIKEKDQDYRNAIRTYLAFLLCKHLFNNSMGIVWNKTGEKIETSVVARRPSMAYNFAEGNPFERGRGALPNALDNISNAIQFATANNQQVQISIKSILQSEDKEAVDLIITDPPYLDDVQYAELSEFLYVWLFRALKNVYPELPPSVPVEEDISVSWGRFGNKKLAEDFYGKAMKQAFQKMYTILRDDGLIVVFFAHSSPEAWNLLLDVLRESKLRVVSSYAIHTENSSSIYAIGKTSFVSSIIVSCRKMLTENSAYFEDLLPKIEDKIKKMLTNLGWEEILELPITDLLIMAYGKVLEEATQFGVLKSYRADFKPEFEVLIRDAREFILKEIVTKLTGRSPNALGSEMSFYLVNKVFFAGLIGSDEALKMSLAYQVKLDDLEKKHVIKKVSGDTRLLFFDEVHIVKKAEEVDKNNLHQQLLFLEGVADREGISGVKRALQFNNFRIQDLKQVITLLIKSYRIRLNKEESLNIKEDRELKILEVLADLFNSSIKTGGGSLDKFM